MQMIHRTVKERIESATGVNAYPVFVPLDVELPAVSYRLNNAIRDFESSQNSTTVTEHTFDIFAAAKDFTTVENLTTGILDSFDGTGEYGEVMTSEVMGISDDFDFDQTVYVQVITIKFKVRS